MAVNLSLFAGVGQQFFDNNGVILSGGLIYSYAAGTTTPQATYTSNTGLVARTNPIVLDSTGRVPSGGEIWLTDNVNYKFEIQTSTGVSIAVYDNVSGNASGVTNAINTAVAGIYANLAASSGSSLVGYIQGAANSTARTVQSKLRETVSVKDFGAVGDGVSDDTVAITNAIATCQSTFATLQFPPGNYVISSTITLSGQPVLFMGQNEALWQRGSTLTNVTLTWTGGASPMFTVSNTDYAWVGMNVQNKGTATDFIAMEAGSQRIRLKRISFEVATGASEFSRSIIYSNGNRVGYSEFSGIYFTGAAPKFIYINGNLGGITPFSIKDRSIFESSATQASTIVYVKNDTLDTVNITDCTFNQQGAQLTILDTTDTPYFPKTIGNFNFLNNEWDYSAGSAATDRMMRLTNVNNIVMNGNNFQCGGVSTSAIDLVNSNISQFEGNYIRSISTFFSGDSSSYVNIGSNVSDISNVDYLVNTGAKGVIPITWATPNTYFGLQAGSATRNAVYNIDVTAGSAWNIGFRNGSSGYVIPGQVFTLRIKNTSGGVIANPTFDSDIKTAGAFVAPANGYNRSITFVFDGVHFTELYRTSADVAN